MKTNFQKYVGTTVETIYLDKNNQLSQRVAQLKSIKGDLIHVFCLRHHALRTFKTNRILALFPAKKHVV